MMGRFRKGAAIAAIGAMLAYQPADATQFYISASVGTTGIACSDSNSSTLAQSPTTPWCDLHPSGYTFTSTDVVLIVPAGGPYSFSGNSYFSFPNINYTSGRATLGCMGDLSSCFLNSTSTTYATIMMTASHWRVTGLNVSSTGGDAIRCQAFPAGTAASYAPVDIEVDNNQIGPATQGGFSTIRSVYAGTGNLSTPNVVVPGGTPAANQPAAQFSCDYMQIHDNAVWNASLSNSNACFSHIDLFGLMDFDNHSAPHGWYVNDWQHPVWVYKNLIFGNPGTTIVCNGSSTGDSDSNEMHIRVEQHGRRDPGTEHGGRDLQRSDPE